MLRGYDSSALNWKDEILRIRHLEAEIADMQKEIARLREQPAARERRIQRLEKELGFNTRLEVREYDRVRRDNHALLIKGTSGV